MSIETISFLLGAGLIAIAILGGGIEIRELKVPQVGTFSRGLAFVFGAAFIGLTLYLRQPPASAPEFLGQRAPSASADIPSQTPDRPAPSVEPANGELRSDPDAVSPVNNVTSTSQVFLDPLYDGKRLDVCFVFAARCGEEPASAWCKSQGFDRAINFSSENVGNRGIATKLIGANSECQEDFCVAFTRIECARD